MRAVAQPASDENKREGSLDKGCFQGAEYRAGVQIHYDLTTATYVQLVDNNVA
jgi:hypothetical protein